VAGSLIVTHCIVKCKFALIEYASEKVKISHYLRKLWQQLSGWSLKTPG